MSYNFFIIGGDLRIFFLAKLLKRDGHNVKMMGFDKIAKEELESEKIKLAKTIEEIGTNDIVISSIPLSLDGKNVYAPYSIDKIPLKNLRGKNIISGKITKEILNEIYGTSKYMSTEKEDIINISTREKSVAMYDILKDEPNTILNTIPTAEGAISKAIEDTAFSIVGANVLVLGFGKVGKTLCHMLKNIGSNVYAEARKETDLAWIEVYGYKPVPLNNLRENICKMDIIFNTIPHMMLDKSHLLLMKKETLVIDLASKPGGVDFDVAKKMGINAYLYSGIPGKIAPETTANSIKKYIERKLPNN